MKSTLKMFLAKLDRVVAGYSNIIRIIFYDKKRWYRELFALIHCIRAFFVLTTYYIVGGENGIKW